MNFPRFFCGQGLLNFFIHAEVNKFPYIFAALRQENFSAHLSASDDGGSGLPLRRQFLSGEERILAAGVARKFLKRKKERKKDREIFPPFSLSRYLLLISSGIVDRKLINTYPRRNISSSTRLASSFFSLFFLPNHLRVTLSRVNMKIQRSSSPRGINVSLRFHCGMFY